MKFDVGIDLLPSINEVEETLTSKMGIESEYLQIQSSFGNESAVIIYDLTLNVSDTTYTIEELSSLS